LPSTTVTPQIKQKIENTSMMGTFPMPRRLSKRDGVSED